MCRVNNMDLPVAEIADSAFSLNGSDYNNYGSYMKLEFIQNFFH